MAPIYKEAAFPADYREAEVGQIMTAVYRLRSIAVTGLAGMGKSNVVRFIVSHPQVGRRYLKERAGDYAFVHVDCAGLVTPSEIDILDEFVAQLRSEGLAPGDAPVVRDPRHARRVVKERILGLNPRRNLVLALDYFDEAAPELDRSFFNYLFHLRNARPRGNLSYIFITRRPMGHLYELQELLDEGCVVGPLSAGDALNSIRRDEARLGRSFSDAQRRLLMACTGGHPGFLKNATELLASGDLDASRPAGEAARQLLRSGRVRNLCQELWRDLTPPEQAILLKVAGGTLASEAVDDAGVAFLERSGVLVRQGGERRGPGLAVFCPLFETFVHERESAAAGSVRIVAVFPNRARIETLQGEDEVTLSPRLFALLSALVEARGRALPVDEIITQVYGQEAAGVSNAALSQLVKRLRGALDPRVRKKIGDPTYTCVETIRNVGYRFNG